ncbi:unnamed protein product [Notodromas monacha]|uniref:Uncharacterized protein n=1 Tax=Notodromas monacha TaxID=399045 RepID=A0A7R9BDM5_9CRUS|nr:unnamed protein product [Notodromas monacha]CAG0912713.1 unnamed protein product [Notodromas monacha]
MLSLRSARMSRLVIGTFTFLVFGTTVLLFMVHDARNEIREKEEKARQCYQNAESLNSQLHVSKGKVKQLEDSLRMEIDARKEETNKLRMNVEKLTSLRTQDRTDKEIASKRNEETISSLRKQIDELQDELSKAVETNHDLLRDKANQASRVDEAVRELEKYKLQASDITRVSLVDEFHSQDEMKRQIDELKVELGDGGNCKAKLVELQKELDGAHAKLAELGFKKNDSLRINPGGALSSIKPSLSSAHVENSAALKDGVSRPKYYPLVDVRGRKMNRVGVGPAPHAMNVGGNAKLQNASKEANRENVDKVSSPKPKAEEVKPMASVIICFRYKKAGVKNVLHVEDKAAQLENNEVEPRPGWNRRSGAVPINKAHRGDQNQVANNYADFDDGDANRHHFDQVGDAEVPVDRLKPRYDYIGESNQEEGDDAVDGRIPVPGEDEIKDDNIIPAPPLEQLGHRAANMVFQEHKRRPMRQVRSRGEAGEVFVVSGNDGEEGVMVNPH